MINQMHINQEYLQELDTKLELIPLTFDPAFKTIFGNNLNLLKKFLISVLNLEISEEECTIKILNPDLPIEKYNEYHKTIDIYVILNEKIYIELEVNRRDFNKVKLRNNFYKNKLASMLLEKGDKISRLNDIYLYQLNLNTENKTETHGTHEIVPYDIVTQTIYIENEKTILKYLAFYRKLYYTKEEDLTDEIVWLASLTAENFTELYEMLDYVLSDEERENVMKEVIKMSSNRFNIHEWEKEKCEELVRLESERIEREEGIEQGKEESMLELIKAMAENGASLDFISKTTKKSITEIQKIINE